MAASPGTSLTRQQYDAGFRDSYARYYHLSLHVVGDSEAARDIVSDVFVELWRRREAVESSTVESYLFRCVRNASIDYLKRQRRAAPLDAALLAHLANDADSWREQDERIGRMESIVAGMTDRTRDVLHKRYAESKSYKEVAAEMGISIDGVKAHVVRAMKTLRQKMKSILW